MTESLGVPLDLLAHWQYRKGKLWTDKYTCEQTIKDTKRALASPPVRSINVVFNDYDADMDNLQAELATLSWLYEEADYWSIRLDIQVRYEYLAQANDTLEAYLNRVAEQGRSVTPPKGNLASFNLCPNCHDITRGSE